MKTAVVAAVLAAMASAALAAEPCRGPAKEYWHNGDGKAYVAALIHLPCEGWGAKSAPKGAWIETLDADTGSPRPWLHIKWNDAVKAGIVEEKARHKKFSGKCEPTLEFQFRKGKLWNSRAVLYPCGAPGSRNVPAGVEPARAFGTQGFEFSSPDLTGHIRLRDKATGKSLDCYNGSCS